MPDKCLMRSPAYRQALTFSLASLQRRTHRPATGIGAEEDPGLSGPATVITSPGQLVELASLPLQFLSEEEGTALLFWSFQTNRLPLSMSMLDDSPALVDEP